MKTVNPLPFQPGDQVDVRIADDPSRGYSLRILDIQPGHIAVSAPRAGNEPIGIVPGQRWDLTAYNQQLGVSQFAAKVIQVVVGLPTEVWLELPARLRRWQRRSMVRMPLHATVSLTDVEASEIQLQGHSRDLSGEGMAVLLDRHVSAGSLWNVKLTLPDGSEVETQARCVRSEKIRQDVEDKWLCGFQFINLDAAVENALVQTVFREERKRLRRRKLGERF